MVNTQPGPAIVHVFGLTGGIASGKSTVGARLRARGVPLVDADELAREAVAPGSDGLRAVVAEFGPGVLDASGCLDRKALARVVFADDRARARLNAIVHPRVGALSAARAAAAAATGAPIACYEAALIVENGLADGFRPLVVCACPEPEQLRRLRDRDSLTLEEALARVRAQAPLAAKVAAADYVIDTGGPIANSARRTDEVLSQICARFGIDPARYSQ